MRGWIIGCMAAWLLAGMAGIPRAFAGGTSIVVFGDLAPVNAASVHYLAEAVRETNLLRPTAVFTVGGLIPGMTRDPQQYEAEAQGLRQAMGKLDMPWYPCVGETEVVSGTRAPADRTFERAYQKLFGRHLYYSVNVHGAGEGEGGEVGGGVHVIVLDSEEGRGAGNEITEEQLAWLKADLNKTFVDSQNGGGAGTGAGGGGGTKIRWVVVLVHRPLWRLEAQGSNWQRVHRLLVDFNQRPIVSVEGDAGSGAGVPEGPQVAGVWAGDARAYAYDGLRDGIRYTVVGATAARIDQDAAIALRHFTLLKLDDQAGGIHPALVKLAGRLDPQDGGGAEGGGIVAENVVTWRQRQVLDAIAALPNDVMGVAGAVDFSRGLPPPLPPPATPPAEVPAPAETGLVMHVGNPLDVPLDVQIRLASVRDLSTATERENANPFVEDFDAPWQMDIPHQIRHLQPGAKEAWPMRLTWVGGRHEEDVKPAQVEFVVRWNDRRAGKEGGEGGGEHEIVLKRRVAVVPRAEVPVVEQVAMTGDEGWSAAAQGETFAWRVRADEPQERSPEWSMVADAKKLYVRVRVEDPVKSYWPVMTLDQKWGGLASDAVRVTWAQENGKAGAVWVLPFGPKGAELWTEGAGGRLERLADANGMAATVEPLVDGGGYVMTCALPREQIFGEGTETRLNITVSLNEGGAQTWTRSWADGEEVGGWGLVALKDK